VKDKILNTFVDKKGTKLSRPSSASHKQKIKINHSHIKSKEKNISNDGSNLNLGPSQQSGININNIISNDQLKEKLNMLLSKNEELYTKFLDSITKGN